MSAKGLNDDKYYLQKLADRLTYDQDFPKKHMLGRGSEKLKIRELENRLDALLGVTRELILVVKDYVRNNNEQ